MIMIKKDGRWIEYTGRLLRASREAVQNKKAAVELKYVP
jgi:hypothetical protein